MIKSITGTVYKKDGIGYTLNEKTEEDIHAEIQAEMMSRHGKAYVYKRNAYWSDFGPIGARKSRIIGYTIRYRKGEMYIAAHLTTRQKRIEDLLGGDE